MKKFINYLITASVILIGCNKQVFRPSFLNEKAPENFRARFETTKGNFEIRAERNWSPIAVDRLYQLISHGYFKNIPLYRVEQDFVVQFGSLDSLTSLKTWETVKIPDESVLKSNLNATLSFARGGKDTRANQLFVNVKDNARLDTINFMGVKGFPVVAVVTSGMENIRKFWSHGLGMPAMPDSVKNNPEAYLKVHYTQMDYIKKAYMIRNTPK